MKFVCEKQAVNAQTHKIKMFCQHEKKISNLIYVNEDYDTQCLSVGIVL